MHVPDVGNLVTSLLPVQTALSFWRLKKAVRVHRVTFQCIATFTELPDDPDCNSKRLGFGTCGWRRERFWLSII